MIFSTLSRRSRPAAKAAASVPPPAVPAALPAPPAGGDPRPAPGGGPNRTAAIVVVAIMAIAATLFALGYSSGAVLGLLGGAAYIAVEAVKRLGGGGGAA